VGFGRHYAANGQAAPVGVAAILAAMLVLGGIFAGGRDAASHPRT